MLKNLCLRIRLIFGCLFLSLCGLFRFVSPFAPSLHLPMQKRVKMVVRRVSVVMAPVMVAR